MKGKLTSWNGIGWTHSDLVVEEDACQKGVKFE